MQAAQSAFDFQEHPERQDDDHQDLQLDIPRIEPVIEYVRQHQSPNTGSSAGHAANDCRQLALAGFLEEHMRKRANATPEPLDTAVTDSND